MNTNKNTSNTNVVHGFEALSVLSNIGIAGDVKIIEHNAGIDIDNAGRGYDHEREVDVERMYFVALLYVGGAGKMPDGYTINDLFTAEWVDELVGNTTTKLLWFHVNEDIYDGESRGTHYKILYSTYLEVLAEDVRAGDEVLLPWRDDFRLVDSKYYEDDRTVSLNLIIEPDSETTEYIGNIGPSVVLKVRRWA